MYTFRFFFLDQEDVANLCFGIEEETSVHVLCECEALASLRHTYLGSFFLDPEDIKSLSLGPSGNLVKEQGYFNPVSDHGVQGAYFKA